MREKIGDRSNIQASKSLVVLVAAHGFPSRDLRTRLTIIDDTSINSRNKEGCAHNSFQTDGAHSCDE